MTEPVAFDTHKFVKRLTENGFTQQQAEVLADEQVNLLNSNLATKADIEKLTPKTKTDIEQAGRGIRADIEQAGRAIRADIENLRLDILAAIAATKVELLRWILGALIAQGGLVVALVKLL